MFFWSILWSSQNSNHPLEHLNKNWLKPKHENKNLNTSFYTFGYLLEAYKINIKKKQIIGYWKLKKIHFSTFNYFVSLLAINSQQKKKAA